uniref:Uncharacterized protein n=1 Tax=Noctiluca scintillans TaxID=2966 RepID=A0A7S1F627_NOCSC
MASVGACSRAHSSHPWASSEFSLDGMISPAAEQLALRSLQVAMPEVLARMEESGPNAIRSFSQATGAVAPQFPRLPSRTSRNRVPSRGASAEPRQTAQVFASRAEIVKETTELMERRIDEVRRSWEVSFSLFLTKLEPVVAAHSQRSAHEFAAETARESGLRARVLLLEEKLDALNSRLCSELVVQSKVFDDLNSRVDMVERRHLMYRDLSQSLAEGPDKLQSEATRSTSVPTHETHEDAATGVQRIQALVDAVRGQVAERAAKIEVVEGLRALESSLPAEAPRTLQVQGSASGSVHSAWRTPSNDRTGRDRDVESNASSQTRELHVRLDDEPEHIQNIQVPLAGKPMDARTISRHPTPLLTTRSNPYAKVEVYELDRSATTSRRSVADQSTNDSVSSKTVQELRRGLSQERQDLQAMLHRNQKETPRLSAKRGRLLSPKRVPRREIP